MAASIKGARVRRHWTINELAERVGVSHPRMIKVERGDPTVAIATCWKRRHWSRALFDADPLLRLSSRPPDRRAGPVAQGCAETRVVVDDDFCAELCCVWIWLPRVIDPDPVVCDHSIMLMIGDGPR